MSKFSAIPKVLAISFMSVALGGLDAFAESLTEALVSAYSSNPALRAARAGQRGIDEQVPQALSGWRPIVTAQGSVDQVWSETNVTGKSDYSPKELTIALSQPVFSGFQTVYGTKVAEANVRAGRQNLLATEQNIIFQAIQAYFDVIRDRQILVYQQDNLVALQKQLTVTMDRLDVGEATETDVAQARASISQGQTEVALADAALATSIDLYIAVIGHAPGSLKAGKKPGLPRSLDEALAIAQEVNATILAAAYVEKASSFEVEVAKGNLLPNAQLIGSATFSDDPGIGVEASQDMQIQGLLTVPLYEAGLFYSQVRQAKQVASQNKLNVIVAARTVRQGVSDSWHNYEAATKSIVSGKAQVSANELALQGVRDQYLAGTRTTLDVLNAQSLVNTSLVSLVSAQHDQMVAVYQILGSMGKLTARDLRLPVNYYDVEENYRNVRNKWFGTSADTIK